jgi:DNA processing protein
MTYPKQNIELAESIFDNGGVLLSEYLYGTGALTNYFVERDRLQSGLSKATIVIQTDEKGGTMHAVNATIKSNKKLAAIKFKGDELLYSKTKGNELLIREGKAFPLSSENLAEFLESLDQKELPTAKSALPEGNQITMF